MQRSVFRLIYSLNILQCKRSSLKNAIFIQEKCEEIFEIIVELIIEYGMVMR